MQKVSEIIEQMSLTEVDQRNADLAYQLGYYEALGSRRHDQAFFMARHQGDYDRGYEQGAREMTAAS